MGNHSENEGHFEFENTRNSFTGAKYPEIHVLFDPLSELSRELILMTYANYLELPNADRNQPNYFPKWIYGQTKSTENKLKTQTQGRTCC